MDWQRLARANTHPLRISVLEVLAMDGGRTLSPSDLSYELRVPLSNVNYHVTELVKSDLIELTSQRQVRGATEHFYRLIDHSAARLSTNGRGPDRQAAGNGIGNGHRPRRADDGSRTRDLELGKLALYQLSYVRAAADSTRPRAAPGSNLPARERPLLPRLPRRAGRRRPARLRPAQQGLGEDRGRRPGAGPRAAGRSAARARARSPTTGATGSWSTSGPPGATPAATRRRRWSASARRHRDRGVTVLGIDVQDNSDDALAFVDEFGPPTRSCARSATSAATPSARPACRRTSSSTRGDGWR